MADIKISNLTNYDPLADGYIFPISKKVDGVWKSGRVTSDTFANYVSDDVLSKLQGVDNVDIAKEESTGKWLVKVDIDTTLFKICDTLPTEPASGDVNRLHLIPGLVGDNENGYIEYGWVDGKWEKMGERKADVDLTPYMKTADFNALKLDEKIADAKKAGTDAGDAAGVNATAIEGLKTRVTTVEGKVTTLESDVTSLKTAVGDETAGLVKEVADDKKTLADHIAAYEAKMEEVDTVLGGVATDTGLSELNTKVSKNITDIATLNTEVATKLATTDFNTAKTDLDTKIAAKANAADLDSYVTKEVYEAHVTDAATECAKKAAKADVYTKAEINGMLATDGEDSVLKDLASKSYVGTAIAELNLTTKLAAKADATVTDSLSESISTINAALPKKLEASDLLPYAKTEDVNTAIAVAVEAIDVTDQLKDYAKSTDVNTIKSTLEEADEAIKTRLAKVEALEARIKALEDKLANYDTRFGYADTVNGEDGWTKSFLLVD